MSVHKLVLVGSSLFLLLAGSSGCVYGKRTMATIDAHHLSAGGSTADAQEKSQDIVSSPAGDAGDETIVPSTPPSTETPPPPPPPPAPPSPPPPPPPPPPPAPVVDPGCKTDSDCPSGQTCDTNQHQCVTPWVPPYTQDPGYCSSDQECTSAHGVGWTCSEDRLCVAPSTRQALPPVLTLLTLGEDTDLIDVIGGSGGTGPDSLNCPQGQVMIGFSLKSGAVIDSIEGVQCEPVYEVGTSASRTINNATLGGTEGGPDTIFLDNGAAISGFQIKASPFNASTVVSELKAFAKPVDLQTGVQDSAEYEVPGSHKGQGDPNTSWIDLKCPTGYLATGLSARHGVWVDALGLNCTRVVLSNQTPVAHPTAELGFTGMIYEFGPVVGMTGGGSGGAFGPVTCAANQVMVGAAVYSGEVVDGVSEIACADANDVANRGGTDINPTWIAVNAGGNAGHVDRMQAPLGYALTGWSNKIGAMGSTVVSELVFHMVPMNTASGVVGARMDLGHFGQGNINASWAENDCPIGSALVGLKGLSGAYLDNLGGICQRVGH